MQQPPQPLPRQSPQQPLQQWSQQPAGNFEFTLDTLLPQGVEDRTWVEVLPPLCAAPPDISCSSLSYVQNKYAWKDAMAYRARVVGGLMVAHGIEGTSWCKLCPRRGWGYARHLPAEMHRWAVGSLTCHPNDEAVIEEMGFVGGRLWFNHALGSLCLKRVPETPVSEAQTIADLPSEGVWHRVHGRCSALIHDEPRCEDYPLLSRGRECFKRALEPSWALLRCLFVRHGVSIEIVCCDQCSTRHGMQASNAAGKKHYDTIWSKAKATSMDFGQFWQTWCFQFEGMRGAIRHNHLSGEIELCRGDAISQLPLPFTPTLSIAPSSQLMQSPSPQVVSVPPPVTFPRTPGYAQPPAPVAMTTVDCGPVPGSAYPRPSSSSVAHASLDEDANICLMLHLWRERFRIRTIKLEDALLEEGLDPSSYRCQVCQRAMGEGLSEHISSLDHMYKVEASLRYFGGVVPAGVSGETGLRNQQFGHFWFNHITGEWGRVTVTQPITTMQRAAESELPTEVQVQEDVEEVMYDFDGSKYGTGYLQLKTGMCVQRLSYDEATGWAMGRCLDTDSTEGWYPPDFTK